MIDTNILIALEDPGPISADLAELVRACSEHNITIYVHEISFRDIRRDKNISRRDAMLSRVRKFEILEHMRLPAENALESQFGRINNENDSCDVALLYTLDRDIVDFLLTHDNGIHARARAAGLDDRVFRVNDALDWVRNTYEPKSIPLPFISERRCYQLNTADPIFDTLRQGYPDFDSWFKRNPQRHCWVLEIGDETAGIIIRKDLEPRAETDALSPGQRILKIATFKVGEKYRGEKFGEHLLKKVLWHAQRNRYDLVYLTAFADSQPILVDLLTQYGFTMTGNKAKTGEEIYEKSLAQGPVTAISSDILNLDRLSYPRFVSDHRVSAYCIPIQPRWYQVLFPENAPQPQLPFEAGINRTPGNTIRKVYLCRTPTKQMLPGSILLFYLSGTKFGSRAVRTIGIVEKLQHTSDSHELLRLTGKRSVYSETDQLQMLAEGRGTVKVIDFILVGHLEPPISLREMVEKGALNAPPQSIVKIDSVNVTSLQLFDRLGFQ